MICAKNDSTFQKTESMPLDLMYFFKICNFGIKVRDTTLPVQHIFITKAVFYAAVVLSLHC